MQVKIICPNPKHATTTTKRAVWGTGPVRDKRCKMCGRFLFDEPHYITATLAPWSEQVKDNSQSWGYVLTDERGHPVWIGNPERTRDPSLTVYDNYAKARRRLTSVFKATLRLAGQAIPMRITPMLLFDVDKKGPLITPKLRKTDDV